ncbi:MAG: hypothetical protein WCC41_07820 [Rhodomicrobium sp.]
MAASINIPVYSDALVVLGTAGIIVPLAKRWGLNPSTRDTCIRSV